MSDAVTSSVELAVSPEVAFDVFVREIDAWYRVDAETLPDITRTAAIRFEPCLGGRLLDVHDIASGEGRELGRITVWEPGLRLVFRDNEGSEVEVTFERRGEGTRVTLTHRVLDGLAPNRAAALRRSGWAALAPLLRDHVAPNARPIALAVGSLVLPIAIGTVALLVVFEQPTGWIFWGIALVTLASLLAVGGIEDRLARRWLPSQWHYRRIQGHVLGLCSLGLLAWGLLSVVQDRDGALLSTGIAAALLMSWWHGAQQGPAGGRSLRTPAEPDGKTFLQRHSDVRLLLLAAGVLALSQAVFAGLASIHAQLDDLFLALMIAVLVAWQLQSLVSRRRERTALGFNPDLYLAVERAIGEGGRPPELLIHQPSKRPEYSGWYAYADDRDRSKRDLVTWSMKDLIDHSPEAAGPLRAGRGKWRWDQALAAYKPIEHQSSQPHPA